MTTIQQARVVAQSPKIQAHDLEYATGQRVQMVWGEGLRSEQKRSSLDEACRIHDRRNRRSVK